MRVNNKNNHPQNKSLMLLECLKIRGALLPAPSLSFRAGANGKVHQSSVPLPMDQLVFQKIGDAILGLTAGDQCSPGFKTNWLNGAAPDGRFSLVQRLVDRGSLISMV